MRPLAADTDTLPEEWETLLKNIYAGSADLIDDATALSMARNFMKAIYEGYDGNFMTIDYGTPDFEMLASLERDILKFSASKSYQINREMISQLKDGDTVRTFTQWRKECLKIVDTWNNNWGQTEYNTFIGSAQGAADWTRFKANEDTMPLLKFVAIHDRRTCPICAEFDGLIRPINDPAWDSAYVPLHFGDRCRCIQLADGTPTPQDKTPDISMIPKMFQVNLAKEGLAAPPEHPYYIGVPKKELKRFMKTNTPDHDQ